MASLEPNRPQDGHLSEEDLVWFYYGEAENATEIDLHLAVCDQCRSAYELCKVDLLTVENWPVPERNPGYGEQVWRSLVKRDASIGRPVPRWRRWFSFPRLAIAASVCAMLCVAFLAGRYTHQPEPVAVTNETEIRERLFAAALGDHLEQSERTLLEITNGSTSSFQVEQERAENLLRANRLFRVTAEREGHSTLASVLDDLERVLLDVANGPVERSAEQLDLLRDRVTDQELLFKVRVLELKLQDIGSRPLGRDGEKKLRG